MSKGFDRYRIMEGGREAPDVHRPFDRYANMGFPTPAPRPATTQPVTPPAQQQQAPGASSAQQVDYSSITRDLILK